MCLLERGSVLFSGSGPAELLLRFLSQFRAFLIPRIILLLGVTPSEGRRPDRRQTEPPGAVLNPQDRRRGCSIMSSGRVESAVEPRLHRLAPWFDPESAAVVTILLGMFQMLLSASLAHTNQTLPKLFVLPLFMGILIVAGGSFTFANERNPSRLLLRGCACSNVVGLLGALLAFCLYCYNLSTLRNEDKCVSLSDDHYYYHHWSYFHCPAEHLHAYSWSVTLLLLLYDCVAVVMHCLLSASAFTTLK